MTGRRLLPRLGLALIASGLAFVLCEVGARMIFPPPPIGTRQPEIGYLRDPEVRYVMAPGQQGWIDDGLVSVNSLGFRGSEVVLPKPPGRFRIVVTGDSLTLGWGVGDDETYAARLEQLLRNRFPDQDLDVINLGVGGYNTRQEVAILERNVPRLQPDLVIVGFYLNDVPEALADEEPAGGKTGIAAGKARADELMHLNPTPSGWWNRLLRRSRLLYIAGRAFNRMTGAGERGQAQFEVELDVLAGRESPQIERAWNKIATQFERLRGLADAQGFAVGIVALSCREQIMDQSVSTHYPDALRATASPLGFHVIDPSPLMRDSRIAKQELFIPYDRNHPSAEGHALIAQAIFRYLEEHDLVTATRPPQAGP